jgi:hypothetical protein
MKRENVRRVTTEEVSEKALDEKRECEKAF